MNTIHFDQLPAVKQKRIIDASIKEFSGNGYGSASLNKVVKAAGISKGSLFNYFNNKSSLFLFVYDIALKNVKQYLRTVRDETEAQPFFIRLEKIMHAGVDFISIHPRLARIYFRILYTSDSPHSQEILVELRKLSGDYLVEIVQEGILNGDLNPNLKIERAVFIIDSVLNRFLHECHQSSGEMDVQAWINDLKDIFARGMKK
ncbi:MAG: TetR/AcrR family transcriptional regulator [Candidatus Neomarinimicrobiota bacterium]